MSDVPSFDDVEKPTRTRDGRQWLKNVEWCDAIKSALKSSYDNETYKSTTVIGKAELRKLRGALRFFTDEEGWGLTVKTEGDESSDDPNESFTVTFLARVKQDAPELSGPRRVRRRKDETEEEYDARIREATPRKGRESDEKYEARIEALKSPAS